MDYFSVKKYKCTHCQLQFHSKNVLNSHKKFHKSSTQLVCKLCLRVFHHKLMLRFHIKSHIGKRIWECKICGKNFFNKANLQQHEAVHGVYKCNLCGKAFTKVHLLKQHVVKDHTEAVPNNVRCKACGVFCKNRIRLKSHMRACSGDNKTVKPSCSSVHRDGEKAGPSSRL